MTENHFTLDLGDPLRAGVFFVTPEDIAILQALVIDAGLHACPVDLRGCTDKATLLARMAGALAMPDGRGRNWDALGDALRDLSWLPAPGYVLLVRDAHELRDADEAAFDTLVGLLDEASAEWATLGSPFWAFLALPEEDFEDAAD
ncbi:MAG TPA: barstar family protein [Thermomonas sp.]|nr:barstar family protein [Thermomonas sp.]